MHKHQCRWLFSFLLLCGPAVAIAGDEKIPNNIGQQIANVGFADAKAQAVSLESLKGKKATVVVFLSFDCPVATSYCQPLADLSRANPDVKFVGVISGEEIDGAQLVEKTESFKIPFPVLTDKNLKAADAFKADMMPEAFVLDEHGKVRYRGRIDNGYAARLRKNNQTTRYDLKIAIEEVLAGKTVSQPMTQAIGCVIPRYNETKTVSKNAPTYHKDVLPILQDHCQGCHRPGEVGPFSLVTYRQAVNWASDIKDYTKSRKMPPWKPSEGLAFHNERKLSDKDISMLAAWVDGGKLEGDAKDAPPPRKFVEGWQLGQPDVVLTVKSDFLLGPTGKDHFRCFVFPTNLPEDKYVTAVEVRPGNPRIVHHALLAVDTTGQARKLEQAELKRAGAADETDRGPGYPVAMGFGFLPQGGLSGWAPGQVPRHLPDSTGFRLPKGADVVMQVHYHRDGKEETDRTQIGLYLATKPIAKQYQGLTIPGRFVVIPKGDKHYRVDGKIWVDQDCTLYSVLPHMHMLGKEIKVTMTPPEGKPQTLVAIADWDYNWQETYFFKEPMKIKAGSRLEVEAFYDNSAENPNNPFSPPKAVRFGQQTTDEMCFIFLGATPEKPGRLRPRTEEPGKDTTPRTNLATTLLKALRGNNKN